MRNLNKTEMGCISGGKGLVAKLVSGAVKTVVGKKLIAEIKKNVNPQVKAVKNS